MNIKKNQIQEIERLFSIDLKENSMEKISVNLKNELFEHFLNNNEKSYSCIGISVGCAFGKLLKPEDLTCSKAKEDIILIVLNSALCDLRIFDRIKGLILVGGTSGSHTAILSRSLKIPAIMIDDDSLKCQLEKAYYNNCICSIDGTFGNICFNKVDFFYPKQKCIQFLKKWNTEIESNNNFSNIKIMANADNLNQVNLSLELGCAGIGSCRVEHMFLNDNGISIIKNLIMYPTNSNEFKKSCSCFKEEIFNEVTEILTVLNGKPFTIRLLDAEPTDFVKNLDSTKNNSNQNTLEFWQNCYIRGCRLGLIKKEIYTSQIEAIINSIKEVQNKCEKININIIIPFVNNEIELNIWVNTINSYKSHIMTEGNKNISINIGTMIETPRSALISDRLAKKCQIFNYGTNDLTQFIYSISRKMSIQKYNSLCNLDSVYKNIDREGVGKLLEYSISSARKANNKLIIGVCGEHVNYINSLEFFYKLDIDYISCVPMHVLYIRTLYNIMNIKNNEK